SAGLIQRSTECAPSFCCFVDRPKQRRSKRCWNVQSRSRRSNEREPLSCARRSHSRGFIKQQIEIAPPASCFLNCPAKASAMRHPNLKRCTASSECRSSTKTNDEPSDSIAAGRLWHSYCGSSAPPALLDLCCAP